MPLLVCCGPQLVGLAQNSHNPANLHKSPPLTPFTAQLVFDKHKVIPRLLKTGILAQGVVVNQEIINAPPFKSRPTPFFSIQKTTMRIVFALLLALVIACLYNALPTSAQSAPQTQVTIADVVMLGAFQTVRFNFANYDYLETLLSPVSSQHPLILALQRLAMTQHGAGQLHHWGSAQAPHMTSRVAISFE